MKAWRVHLFWLVIVVVSVATAVRVSESGLREEHRRETRIYEERIQDLEDQSEPDVAAKERRSADTPEPESPVEAKPEKQPVTLESVRTLLWSESSKERKRGRKRLEKWADKAEQAALLRALINDGGEEQWYQALKILDNVELPDRVDLYAKVIREAKNEWLRLEAVNELGKLQDQTAIPVLHQAYASGDLYTKVISSAALDGLGVSGPSSEVIPEIGAGLQDQDGTRREGAVRMLARYRNTTVIPYLQKAMQDPYTRVREKAAWALGRTGLPSAIPILEKAAGDPEKNVRDEAKKAIERIRKANP